jgi:hypothetical protein
LSAIFSGRRSAAGRFTRLLDLLVLIINVRLFAESSGQPTRVIRAGQHAPQTIDSQGILARVSRPRPHVAGPSQAGARTDTDFHGSESERI